jgi:hypothetical protein
MMGLEQLEGVWDHLPSLEAVLRAWQEPGPSYGSWHKTARAEVAYLMPLLARALDRAQLEHADLLPDRDERLTGASSPTCSGSSASTSGRL